MVTDGLADKYCKLMELAAAVIERDDVPEDLREWALRIFNLHEKLTHYIEPVSDFCDETWAEVE